MSREDAMKALAETDWSGATVDRDPRPVSVVHSARMPAELSAILAHMDALAELDTEGVAPMTHAVPMDLRLRADDVQPSLPVEVALADAPDPVDGFFRVPNIIKTAADS